MDCAPGSNDPDLRSRYFDGHTAKPPFSALARTRASRRFVGQSAPRGAPHQSPPGVTWATQGRSKIDHRQWSLSTTVRRNEKWRERWLADLNGWCKVVRDAPARGAGSVNTEGSMARRHVEALESLNRALLGRRNELKELLAGLAVGDFDKRYRIGVIVLDIMNTKAVYGDRAVERVALSLGQGKRTLYDCGSVAEKWSKSQMDIMRGDLNCHGIPLKWSHYVVLTPIEDVHERETWRKRALEGGWLTKELREEIPKRRKNGKATTHHADAKDTTEAAVLAAQKNVERLRSGLACVGPLLDRLDRDPERKRELKEGLVRLAESSFRISSAQAG
jgi:hypothetical protein